MEAETFDYVICGAGSAGCVLANRLSADPANRVLLLEAGGSDNTPLVRIPAAEIRAIMNSGLNWKYQSQPDPSLGGRADMWPGGKVLGGSSSINGMVYLRGQREDYDGWAASLGNTGAWSYRDILPYFKRMESNAFGAGDYHGGDGPLTTSHVATPHPLAATFIEAGQELGYPYNPDFNGERQEGIGPSQGSIRRGRRHNTGRAYLAPVRSRANLEVRTHAHIDRILFEDKQAVAVRYQRHGEWQEARGGEIILACGSLSSPAVLMRSGIGPGDHLREHGIGVVENLPGVGQNLQEHPIVWVSGYVDVSTYNTEVRPHHFVKHGLSWLLFGSGPAASPITQACAFIRTRPNEETRPDIQLQFVPTGYKLVPEGLLLMDRPAITILVNVCRPESRSTLRLASKDPKVQPLIFSNLLGEDDDVERMVAGCRAARAIFESRAFGSHYLGPCLPDIDVQSDSDFRSYIRAGTGPAYHPAGTCKMGRDATSVVDDRLRVRRMDRLRVVDASIMPVVTSANTNAPTIMIGEKASDLILEDQKIS
ncbi:MAG: GMC family oxidoreductase N-terminal domain-containing protein [Alphaproteobacteria bacterium]|nr:GMC family oxidoreductase N-terminal domain-containing protein [Alphaproteobacteria bacterium]